MIQARLCTQKDFETDWFKKYTKELNQEFCYRRKLWEFVSIVDTLHDLNMFNNNYSGLGFAVGTEPLSSYFIKHGCNIVASDYVIEDSSWTNGNQLGTGLKSLNEHKIISDKLLSKRAEFKNVDMNNIPENLKDEEFDFLWSSCAFEHLGSLENGLKFVKESLKCLTPGGFAIHTTEFNCNSNINTISEGNSVIYRKQDIERLENSIKAIAKFYPIDYSLGNMEYDYIVDSPPYFSQNIHLKLDLFGYTTTSLLIIIQKK